MKQKRMRRDGKPWHNNIGPWIEALTTDEKKALVQKATRAQWGPAKDEPKKAGEGPGHGLSTWTATTRTAS